MSPATDGSLADSRELMRLRLSDQRERIADRLGPPSADRNGFPRSITVRLVMRRPDLALRIVMRVASLVRGK